MSSRGKKKTTMAKLSRESRLRERRAEKEARKQARRDAPPSMADHAVWPDEPVAVAPAPEETYPVGSGSADS